MAQRISTGIASFPLLAIPFFILSGILMGEGGMARRLIDFANAVITDLLDGNPRRKFILMSCSLRGLLLSILKKQVEAANSMESFLAALLQDSDYLTRVQIRSPDSLSLLQQSGVYFRIVGFTEPREENPV